MLQQYADLLNLIDKKDFCTHKAPLPQQQQQQQSMMNLNKSMNKSKEIDYESSVLLRDCMFNLLKGKFYEIIYKFVHINMLNVSK